MTISRRTFVSGALGTFAATQFPSAARATTQTVYFKLNSKLPDLPINPAMIGLSFEKTVLRSYLKYFVGTGGDMSASLMSALGSGTLRFGGATVEWTGWLTKKPNDTSAISKLSIDQLAAFVKKTGWRVIYGINFQTSTIDDVLDEVGYVISKLGFYIHSFELGNEPNYAYKKMSDYLVRWNEIFNAIRTKYPKIPLLGPATSFATTAWLEPFAKTTGENVWLSQHYYCKSGSDVDSTAQKLLADDPAFSAMLKLGTQSAKTYGKNGFLLDEINSFGGGGTPGVSDTFAASLWMAKTLATASSYGLPAIAFHTGGSIAYTPIEYQDSKGPIAIRPGYYGLMLYSQFRNAFHCDYQNMSSVDPGLKFFASCDPNSTNKSVMIINHSFDKDFQCFISGLSPTDYTMIELRAPDIAAKTGITIAGQVLELNSVRLRNLPVAPVSSDGTIMLDVPKLSAVVLRPRVRENRYRDGPFQRAE